MPKTLQQVYDDSPYQDGRDGAGYYSADFAFALPVEEGAFGFRVFVCKEEAITSLFGRFATWKNIPEPHEPGKTISEADENDWATPEGLAAVPKLQVAWADLMTELMDSEVGDLEQVNGPPFSCPFSFIKHA
jgi:hypothetical protein